MAATVMPSGVDALPAATRALLLRVEIDAFNAAYARVLDTGDLRQWPGFFADPPLYRVTSRENYAEGLPLGVMYCDSHGMLQDRVEAILSTAVFAPRSTLHFITNLEVT